MKTAGIIGAAGYTAGELLRLLLHHPEITIAYAQSNSQAGKAVTDIHQDLLGDTDLVFTAEAHFEVDIVFLCMGHGKSKAYLESQQIPDSVIIIDLSQDFRHKANSTFKGRTFTYGLPEINDGAILKSTAIANPGCFATAIQLGLLPLAHNGLLQHPAHIHAITGSTGAGQSLSETSHFSWRQNNVSVYKAFEHQHLIEIKESLGQKGDFNNELNFIPVRGTFTRGIFASMYTEFNGSLEEAFDLYESFYAEAVFTHISRKPIHLKQVVGTNKCMIHLEKHDNKLLVTSIIDNLLKGASGQAVQNMNLMMGWHQRKGLTLKSNAF